MNQLTASEYFNKMGPKNSPDVRRRQKKLKTNSIQNLLEKKLLVLSCSQTELNWPTDGAFFKPDCSFFCFIPFRLEVQIAAGQSLPVTTLDEPGNVDDSRSVESL